jgi:hypothetical protein
VPRVYEGLRPDSKLFRNIEQIRLVGFQEPQQRREQGRLARPRTQFIRPDSGQVEEPAGPAFVAERCGKRTQ